MAVPMATEWTIRDLLQQEFRKRGVTVVPEVSFDMPFGRLMPNIVLKNVAQYVLETKLGTETKLDMIRLYDYGKYRKTHRHNVRKLSRRE